MGGPFPLKLINGPVLYPKQPFDFRCSEPSKKTNFMASG
jgi:hypothetical protein